MSALLAVRDVRKVFGGVHALDGCSLEVEEGSLTALIGPNGSGKTTLFDIVTGYQRPDAGQVEFAGRDVTGHHPGRLHRLGLSRTFQQARVFAQLTVVENLVAATGIGWRGLVSGRAARQDRARATQLLDDFTLSAVADLYAGELSYGQRKLLEFAAAMMSSPRLVLLDEPTAGVNPILVAVMEEHIRARHADGVTFLVVEHDLNVVMRLCETVIVLDGGRRIAAGPPDQIRSDPLVLDAYLGV